MKLNEPHDPRSVELEAKQISGIGKQLAKEEVMSVEADAIENMEDQSLHDASQCSLRRVSLDRPKSTPQDMVYGARQVLKVLDKKFLWKINIRGSGFIMLSISLMLGSPFLQTL